MTTMRLAMGIGAFVGLAGLSLTYFIDLSPGAAIVVLAIGIYALAFLIRTLIDSKLRNRRMRAVVSEAPHPERRSPQDIGDPATSI